MYTEMIKPEDIDFVKSVKRDDGTNWAFYDEGSEDTFQLTFSKTQVKGARLLLPGDIILLFQRVDKHPDRSVKPLTYLTHLVTPKDKELYENELTKHRFRWERKVTVIARAELSKPIFSSPDRLNFYKPQWGKICDVQLLNDNWTRKQIQEEIWNLFKGRFKANLETLYDTSEITDDIIENNFGVIEGKEKAELKLHLRRERSQIIVGLAKSRALKSGKGRIACECCGFDFIAKYGTHGIGYIECHHKIPIATGGERWTQIEDLALVCSNCHRMLHRKNINTGRYFTTEELHKHIISQQ